MAIDQTDILKLAGPLGWGYDKAQEFYAMYRSASGVVEEIAASGALATSGKTELTVADTKAYTLKGPNFVGQTKEIVCVAVSGTPLGNLTVSEPDDTVGFVCPATFLFTSPGQYLKFEATPDLKWRCVGKERTGYTTLTVGTTVTTGIANMTNLILSISGTVASTGTKGVPNGAAVGEIMTIGCVSAADTPHGDIDITARDAKGLLCTSLDDVTATTDHFTFRWDGSVWCLLTNVSATGALVDGGI